MLNKIDTGLICLDILLMILSSEIFIYFNTPYIKKNIIKKISLYFENYNNTNSITFISTEKETSKRFKAIMHYLSSKTDSTINKLIEVIEYKYNKNSESYDENKVPIYRIDQCTLFNIDKNIKGKIYAYDKEKSDFNGRTSYIEYVYFDIFSNKLNLLELEEWINKKVKEYDNHVRLLSIDKQLLIDVSWNYNNKSLDITNINWESNVTFENRFFKDKEIILDKINFFLNNQDWYIERGIPYNLGFLLWGEPGCGKTGFIKAIMNLTKRHGISIKLNNYFDMNKLKEIIFYEELSDNLIIPIKNRIIIFEDVDCMSNIVKNREDNTNDDNKNKNDSSSSNYTSDYRNDNYNNNLSYLLNILDGLQESSGRIIIMTTNKPELLDKALIRPGRIDYNIQFDKANLEDIKNILSHYWKIEVNIDDINKDIDIKYTHAEIINKCRTSSNISSTGLINI